jgi:hypothetical protein
MYCIVRKATLAAGKFAWQLMWTGGRVDGVGGTCPHSIVSQKSCAAELRALCNETAAPQTRAMMYALSDMGPPWGQLKQDLANFLLIRGPFAWLGHHDVKPAGQRDTVGRELGVPGVTGGAAATAESAVVP